MEIETKEKPHILHFQVKNIGFCQQSEMTSLHKKRMSFFILLVSTTIFIRIFR